MAEDKQHPLVQRLGWDFRKFCLQQLAKRFPLRLFAKRIGNHADFALYRGGIVATRHVHHFHLTVLDLLQDQRRLRLAAGEHQRGAQGKDAFRIELAQITDIRQSGRFRRPLAGAVACDKRRLCPKCVDNLGDVAAEGDNSLLRGGKGHQRKRGNQGKQASHAGCPSAVRASTCARHWVCSGWPSVR